MTLGNNIQRMRDDGIKFSVPNQSMPGLMDFTLDFHLSNLYCNIEKEFYPQ